MLTKGTFTEALCFPASPDERLRCILWVVELRSEWFFCTSSREEHNVGKGKALGVEMLKPGSKNGKACGDQQSWEESGIPRINC